MHWWGHGMLYSKLSISKMEEFYLLLLQPSRLWHRCQGLQIQQLREFVRQTTYRRGTILNSKIKVWVTHVPFLCACKTQAKHEHSVRHLEKLHLHLSKRNLHQVVRQGHASLNCWMQFSQISCPPLLAWELCLSDHVTWMTNSTLTPTAVISHQLQQAKR